MPTHLSLHPVRNAYFQGWDSQGFLILYFWVLIKNQIFSRAEKLGFFFKFNLFLSSYNIHEGAFVKYVGLQRLSFLPPLYLYFFDYQINSPQPPLNHNHAL